MSIPWLPLEILAEIIKHTAIRHRKISDIHHTYRLGELKTLCLVSKSFYAVTAPLLYQDIIILTTDELSSLAPRLYPFLSPERRCELRVMARDEIKRTYWGGGMDDAEEEQIIRFLRMDSRVNPQWVKRLTLLQPFLTYSIHASWGESNECGTTWGFIEEAIECMTNIERICWEAQYQSPRLSHSFSKLKRLSHLACGYTGIPCSQDAEYLDLAPLKSLSAYWKGPSFEGPDPRIFRKILRNSSHSLRSLQLSTCKEPAEAIAPIINGLFTGSGKSHVLSNEEEEEESNDQPIRLKSVEEVFFDIQFTQDITTAIIKAVDFSRLVCLQLNHCEKLENFLQALQDQELKFLRKISLRITPYSLVKFLDSVLDLEEIYVLYEKDNQEGHICDTDDVLRAIYKHGKTLRKLMLNMDELKDISLVDTTGVSQLARHCPNLEQLWINIDFNEWGTIIEEICNMRYLEHIYVGQNPHSYETAFTVPGDQKFRTTVCHTHEETLDNFDKAVGLLLESSVAAAASRYLHQNHNTHVFAWRDFSALRSVTISGMVPGRYPNIYLSNFPETNSYVLREAIHTFSHSHRDPYVYHPMPKVGNCYVYEAHGVSIALQNVNSKIKLDKEMDWLTVPLCGWHTAFKPASDCMVKIEHTGCVMGQLHVLRSSSD